MLEKLVKEKFDELQGSIHNFQKDLGGRVEKLEAAGGVPGDIKEQMEKHNDAIDKLIETVDGMQKEAKRPGGGEGDDAAQTKTEQEILAKRAMCGYLRTGRVNTEEEAKAYNDSFSDEIKQLESKGAREFKGLIVGNNNEGGYFVRPQYSDMITKKIFESSPMREVAGQMTISSNELREPADFDEPDASWADEVASVSETDENKVNELSIPVHELRANPRASQMILEDSFLDIEAWHGGKVGEKFGRSEATAFVGGDGVVRPRGFTTYTNGTGYGQVEQRSSSVSASFEADDLIKLQHDLFEGYQSNASWLMHRTTAREVRLFKDSEGRYLWSMGGNLQDGFQNMLLNKPLRWASDMDEIASSAISVAYADFRQFYLIVDRVGISVLRDPYSAKPHVEFYTRKRVGGGVRNFQAGKLLVCGA